MSEQETELLESILAAQVLTLAHVMQSQRPVMNEALNPSDLHAEAVEEIKRNRADIITRLMES